MSGRVTSLFISFIKSASWKAGNLLSRIAKECDSLSFDQKLERTEDRKMKYKGLWMLGVKKKMEGRNLKGREMRGKG